MLFAKRLLEEQSSSVAHSICGLRIRKDRLFMWVNRLTIQNIRCFDRAKINLSGNINLLVGENNSGKSTIIKSIFMVQNPSILRPHDCRTQGANGIIRLDFKIITEGTANPSKYFGKIVQAVTCNISPKKSSLSAVLQGEDSNKEVEMDWISSKAPDNFIYPIFSKRKAPNYSEEVNAERVSEVRDDFHGLYAKVSDISTITHPGNKLYVKACNNILGFIVGTFASQGGRKAGFVQDGVQFPLDSLGEGVANVVGILVDLCTAKGKLFLIEEPENDIHPKALKGLLELIIESSSSNQFIISTHSNIVTSILGGHKDSRIFNVEVNYEKSPPLSSIKTIGNTPYERRELLESLGHSMLDFNLWEGWLFLEESSAERIIREYLMPWFTESLCNRIRTFSAGSLSRIKRKFERFHELFVFVHLSPAYEGRVWVIIDGGSTEEEVIKDMRKKFSTWGEDHFQQFSRHDFEEYYPPDFQEDFKTIVDIQDRIERQIRKEELLEKVVKWIGDNEDKAKESFQESASEVIDKLREIEAKLKG
jgi:energy-coupling factor transporter ATP-binding protein EcfA2